MGIGRITIDFTVEDRINPFMDDASQRRFMVSVFYPSDETFMIEDKSFYIDLFHPCEEEVGQFFHEMGADISQLRTNVFNNTAVIQNDLAYPVIIYSPAFGIERDMYLFHIECLVKKGFIVFTVGAPYESVFTVFPDGQFVKQLNVIGDIEGTNFDAWEQLLDVRTKDIVYLLNKLPDINANHNMLRYKLNLNSIGLIGHSLGGAAVFRVAQEDSRIKAGILLDASLHLLGEMTSTVDIPFLLLRENNSTYEMLLQDGMSEVIARKYMNGQRSLSKALRGYKSFVKINGTNHISFSDVPLHFNESNITEKHELINTLTIAFMKEFLGREFGMYTDFDINGFPLGTNRINEDGEILARNSVSG